MSKERTILLLEDDPNLAFILSEHLEMNGFTIRHCTNGIDGLAAMNGTAISLCLVDVMMPKQDGFTFVKELRRTDQQTPVIFLTARSLKEDRIEGLRLGADDYVTKPFSMEELLLRIHAVLKRTEQVSEGEEHPAEYALGRITFDVRRSRLMIGEKTLQHLTQKEAGVLAILCRYANILVERERILTAVWNTDTYYSSRSMDVYVSKLRKYLSKEPHLSIVTVHGKGFKLMIDE